MPGIRRSRGLFLEVLEPATLIDVPIEVDVFDGGNPASMLATLDGAFAKRFTRELNELGSGGFAIGRTDPKATAANLALGNLVKFRVAGTHRHAIWIEEPATTVVSAGEEGGEDVAIRGRGALAYLERASVYPPVWPPAAADVVASSSADNGTTGTKALAVPKPTGSAAGDVELVGILCVGALPTTPPGWRRIRDITEGTLRLAIYTKRLLTYEPASTTWNWSVVTKASAAAVTLRNVSSDDPALVDRRRDRIGHRHPAADRQRQPRRRGARDIRRHVGEHVDRARRRPDRARRQGHDEPDRPAGRPREPGARRDRRPDRHRWRLRLVDRRPAVAPVDGDRGCHLRCRDVRRRPGDAHRRGADPRRAAGPDV